MRNPSAELVNLVRRRARAWAIHHAYPWNELDDVEGDALEWLAQYEPPTGFDPTAAVLWKLPRALATCARNQKAHRGPPAYRLGELTGRDLTLIRDIGETDPAYDTVDLLDLLDHAELTKGERVALLGSAAGYTLRELGDLEGVTESAVCLRRRTARSRVCAQLTQEPPR